MGSLGSVSAVGSTTPRYVTERGGPQLVATPQRWEAACLLIFITVVDLFGGYTFNIALSRRTMDVAPAASG